MRDASRRLIATFLLLAAVAVTGKPEEPEPDPQQPPPPQVPLRPTSDATRVAAFVLGAAPTLSR